MSPYLLLIINFVSFNRCSKNESETSGVWLELQSLIDPCPNIKFNEVDCASNADFCKQLDLKLLPSYLIFQNNKLIDVYYGQRTVEPMRSYCLSLLGYHIPRSLPVPSATTDGPQPEHTCLRLGASDFEEGIKDGITLVM